MDIKFRGLLFIVAALLVGVNGVAVNNVATTKSEGVNNLSSNSTSTTATPKSQEPSKENEGPVIVSNSPVTVIVPNASEILPKSTTAPPQTNPAPSLPLSPPEVGKWIIRNNTTKTVCIIAQMAMQLNVTYPDVNNKIQNAVINVTGKDSNATGNCAEIPQSINITWGAGHSIQINFEMNKTVKNYYISGISLNVNATVLKNPSKDLEIIKYWNHDNEFMTPLNMSYKCNKVQKINLESEDNKLKAVLSLSDTQFEAYANNTKSEFGEAQDCEVFDTPDIVPIAVGCALAILVLVVLVAYLFGRKRSQNQGYLSM